MVPALHACMLHLGEMTRAQETPPTGRGEHSSDPGVQTLQGFALLSQLE